MKRYFETEDKSNFEEENYIASQMGHDMKWSLSPKYNETISIHPYYQVRNLTDVKVSSREIKVIMYKLIEEVDRAHQKGIIHNDIKSENILIDAKLIGHDYIT